MSEQHGQSRVGAWVGSLWQRLQPRAAAADPVAQATDRVVQIADPVIRQARGYRRVLAGPDRNVQRSLRMLLAYGIGLVLLLFAVIAILVWIFFA